MFKLSNHFKYESILMITFNPNHVALKHLSEMCSLQTHHVFLLLLFSCLHCFSASYPILQILAVEMSRFSGM